MKKVVLVVPTNHPEVKKFLPTEEVTEIPSFVEPELGVTMWNEDVIIHDFWDEITAYGTEEATLRQACVDYYNKTIRLAGLERTDELRLEDLE